MNLTKDEVYTFKLSSGEEIMAKVVSTEGNMIEVTNPVGVAHTPQGMGLIPCIFTMEERNSVMINTNSVTMWTLTADAIKMKYISAISGITVPDKKLILG